MGPRHGMALQGWALGTNGSWAWMGPHGPSGWLGLGQGWALGMDGPPCALGMDGPWIKDEPWAWMGPHGPPDGWPVQGWNLGIDGLP